MQLNTSTLKNCHKNQTILVLGNAHSLCNVPLRWLDDYITIGCNRILRLYTPSYYIVSDRNPYEEDLEYIKKGTFGKLLSTTIFNTSFKTRNQPNVAELPAFDWYPWTPTLHSEKNPENVPSKDIVLDPTTKFYTYKNIAPPMIQFAASMGAKTIGLLGIDMKWPSHKKSHFWGEGAASGSYMFNGKLVSSWIGRLAKEFAKKGIEVINLSSYRGPLDHHIPHMPFSQFDETYGTLHKGKKEKTVSVIYLINTDNLNKERLVQRLLCSIESIRKNTLPSTEYDISVIDTSMTINYDIRSKLSDVWYLHAPTNGPYNRSYNINVGVRWAASGKYIQIADADVVYPNYYLETVLCLAKKTDVLSFQTYRVRNNVYSSDFSYLMTKEGTLHRAGCGVFLSKKVFVDLNGFDEDYSGYGSEDKDFIRRAEFAGYSTKFPSTEMTQAHLSHERTKNLKEYERKNAARFRKKMQEYASKTRDPRCVNALGWGLINKPPESVFIKHSSNYSDENTLVIKNKQRANITKRSLQRRQALKDKERAVLDIKINKKERCVAIKQDDTQATTIFQTRRYKRLKQKALIKKQAISRRDSLKNNDVSINQIIRRGGRR